MIRHRLVLGLGLTWLTALILFSGFVKPQAFQLERALLFPYDSFGRNTLLLVGQAARGSLFFAVITLILTGLSSLAITGLISISPKRLRFLLERGLEFLNAFPSLLIALAAQAILGTGLTTLVLSLGFGLLPGTIRFLMVRARELLSEDYVQSARALGASEWGVFRTHLIPALLDHFRLKVPFIFAQCLGIEATLSFLGLGASPGTVTWGGLLAQGRDYLIEAPYLSILAGTPLLFTLLALGQIELVFSRRKSNIS